MDYKHFLNENLCILSHTYTYPIAILSLSFKQQKDPSFGCRGICKVVQTFFSQTPILGQVFSSRLRIGVDSTLFGNKNNNKLRLEKWRLKLISNKVDVEAEFGNNKNPILNVK